MSIKNIKSIHKIGEKFEVKNPFIKVLCDNHEFEIISIANNIDVKISNIPQPCIPTVFSPYNFRQTIKDKEKKIVIQDVVLYQECDDSNQTIIDQHVDIITNDGTYRSHFSHPPQYDLDIQISHTPNFLTSFGESWHIYFGIYNLVLKHYNDLDEKYRELIPLKMVYIPVKPKDE